MNKKMFWRVFWITVLILSLGYLWYSFYTPADKIAWLSDERAASTAAQVSGKPLLIFFTAKWCVPCRIMKRTVFAEPEVLKIIDDKFTPLLVDIGDLRNANIVARYQIRGTPVTIIANSDGTVIRYIDRGVSKEAFLNFLLNRPQE